MEDIAAKLAFASLAAVVSFFAATNILLTILRLARRRDVADRLSASLIPYTRYFRLGDTSERGPGR